MKDHKFHKCFFYVRDIVVYQEFSKYENGILIVRGGMFSLSAALLATGAIH